MDGLKNLSEILADKLPPIDPCIYFLIRGNQIVYVGQSLYRGARTSAHMKDKGFDSVTFVSCKREELNDLEAEYILKFSPIYNSTLPINSRYATLKTIASAYDIDMVTIKRAVKKVGIKPHGSISRVHLGKHINIEYYEIQSIMEALNE